MLTGWRYRVVSASGAAALTILAVYLANHPASQFIITTYIPFFNRLEPMVLTGDAFLLAVGLSVLAVMSMLIPLYKPRPRRMLDVIALTQKRVLTAGLALAAFGFFKWSHRLPRSTLPLLIAILLLVLPAWFIWIRQTPNNEPTRALIVGDDLAQIDHIAKETALPVLGYLCPTSAFPQPVDTQTPESTVLMTDGGPKLIHGLPRLGGLARLDDVLIEYDIDTVILAFRRADRAEFFGALDVCHTHGVQAKVHHRYANTVLTGGPQIGPLVDVDIEPWDLQDHIVKRSFDVAFSLLGLIILSPLIAVIASAIKLDNPGPVLYRQDRTATFGTTFSVYKFRTMRVDSEESIPVDDTENPHITRVGGFLRRTHLDEIPQLWSILVGKMSVVGPRAVWTDEELLLEEDSMTWRKRWFVKPGLTGLAQINGVTSTDPALKLRYDLQYIRHQSFWYDIQIVVRQIYRVIVDSTTYVWNRQS